MLILYGSYSSVYLIHKKGNLSPDCYSLKVNYFASGQMGKRSFSFYAPRIWNPLPLSVRNITLIDGFKTSLKSYLITQFDDYKQNVNRIITLI